MSAKSALSTVAVLTLALAACTEPASEAREESEEQLTPTEEPGFLRQPFMYEIDTALPLPECGDIDEQCVGGADGGCCQLDGKTVCFCCAVPFGPEPTACADAADCGDEAGAFCALEQDGSGVCKQHCGGIAGFKCDEGAECIYPSESFGTTDAMGICSEPMNYEPSCPMSYMPVCGEDGETYSNPCWAGVKGVAVAHTGECLPPIRERNARAPLIQGQI